MNTKTLKVSVSLLSLIASTTALGGALDGPVAPCSLDVSKFANSGLDASQAMRDCADQAELGSVIELAPGRYIMSRQVFAKKPLGFRTRGKKSKDPRCDIKNSSDCAELFATNTFDDDGLSERGLLRFEDGTNGSGIDHIEVNGNKDGRKNSLAAKSCASGHNNSGFNLFARATNFTFTNNVTRNALCGTGFSLKGGGAIVRNNLFQQNGTHNVQNMWSDGLTGQNLSNSQIENNEFFNNTDVQLIVGGMDNSVIQNNYIHNSTDAASGSFGGLVIYQWDTSETQSAKNAKILNNRIDCGKNYNCTYALLVGADPWEQMRPLRIQGAYLAGNTTFNGVIGIQVNEAFNITFDKSNKATSSGPIPSSYYKYGLKGPINYAIGTESYNITTGGLPFTRVNF